ncbi:hypothetical protein Vadar_018254 [Vaccinium darrowii]|uniref:Uncharacterized protein n=1 Tax=Vaccinium darrowii TaxID=229202 RepID=A0ACB7XRP5_9ERIC|nr:hypothetical protein Vadar_018254 [Vaccinium darrowii]
MCGGKGQGCEAVFCAKMWVEAGTSHSNHHTLFFPPSTDRRRSRNCHCFNWRYQIKDMGFLVTTLIFSVVGIIASLCTRICFNRGPSTNLLHLTLVVTATVCCWMMWAIVYLAQMKPLIVPILSEGE